VSDYGVFLVQYALRGITNQGSIYRGYAVAKSDGTYDPADLAAQYAVSSLLVSGASGPTEPTPVVTGVTAVAGDAVPGSAVIDSRATLNPEPPYVNYAFNLTLAQGGPMVSAALLYTVTTASGSPSPLALAQYFIASGPLLSATYHSTTHLINVNAVVGINVIGQIAFNVN
jgi:hypothetical protein